jgi:hypothetical protein
MYGRLIDRRRCGGKSADYRQCVDGQCERRCLPDLDTVGDRAAVLLIPDSWMLQRYTKRASPEHLLLVRYRHGASECGRDGRRRSARSHSLNTPNMPIGAILPRSLVRPSHLLHSNAMKAKRHPSH